MPKMKHSNKKKVTVTATYLASKGYSISQAATDCCVSKQHLTLVLRGERKASQALLQRLIDLPVYHPVKCRVSY